MGKKTLIIRDEHGNKNSLEVSRRIYALTHAARTADVEMAAVSLTESAWRVHRFEVWSGELVCVCEALRMRDSLLLWVGAGEAPALGELALGAPAAEGGALATALLGHGGEAAALARRLAASLARPVLVCLSVRLDRFTAPLVERALVAEIKTRPECF